MAKSAAKKLTRGIYKRGNVYWLNHQKKKKRRWISLETADLSIAINEATRKRNSPRLESGVIIRHSVDRFIADMIRRRQGGERDGWAPATARSKNYVVIAFADWCGKIEPDEVTPKMVRKYYDARVVEASAMTAFGNLMTIRSYFGWCLKIEKSVASNPCVGLDILAPPRSPRKNFCPAELVDDLINNCPRLDLKFILYCGFHCGLRFLEIVEAMPWWFELNKAQLHLRKTPTIRFKDQEERIIPMTKEFVQFVKNDYGLHEPFMLHPENEHGKNRYRYDFTRPFDLYMKEQGVPWVTPHIMRHTFASLLASTHPMDGGPSDFEIVTWMGIDLRTYQKTYAKLRPRPGATDSAFRVKKRRVHASNGL